MNKKNDGLLILQNGRILTMDDGPELKEADLWIQDGKILRMLPWGSETPEDATCRDISGCVVMPGLIDSHVHYDES